MRLTKQYNVRIKVDPNSSAVISSTVPGCFSNCQQWLCHSWVLPLRQIRAIFPPTVPILAYPTMTSWPLSLAIATSCCCQLPVAASVVGIFVPARWVTSSDTAVSVWVCVRVCACATLAGDCVALLSPGAPSAASLKLFEGHVHLWNEKLLESEYLLLHLTGAELNYMWIKGLSTAALLSYSNRRLHCVAFL